MVMEYVSGGELFHYIVHNQLLSESSARRFFQQILSGVHYCHQRRIVHRDLKPENLLLDSEQRNVRLQISACQISWLTGNCCAHQLAAADHGTAYVGPEVDVWSCGVILFTLLCGSLPFNESDTGTLYRKIKQASFVHARSRDEEAADLITPYSAPSPFAGHIRGHSPAPLVPDRPAGLPVPSDGAHQDYPLLTSWQWAEVATRCRVSERGRCWTALLSDDPQSNQLACGLSAGAGTGGWLMLQGLSSAAPPLHRRCCSSIAASTVSTPTGSSRGQRFATAASKQHPERMQGGKPTWAPGSFAKMSLQLFMVEKDSSFLLDFRLVLPGNPKDREMSPASEAAAAGC
uniref:Protein kinase domain-containing protein n=1 Tax=Macrostomum lignano TaxID=282301 RepID=A0A1I8FIV6_9PLAT